MRRLIACIEHSKRLTINRQPTPHLPTCTVSSLYCLHMFIFEYGSRRGLKPWAPVSLYHFPSLTTYASAAAACRASRLRVTSLRVSRNASAPQSTGPGFDAAAAASP
jgi:hypothetical protein